MNLARLTDSQRAEIERDKQRWFKAWRLIRTQNPRWIRDWLKHLNDDSDRDDWRRRLNTINRCQPSRKR